MRAARWALVALVVVVGLLAVGDVVVKDAVQAAIAKRIEARSPGSHATVHISSFPFVGHLAVSGTVPSLTADVTNVTDGLLVLNRVELHVVGLRVDRSDLLHGHVEPVSLQRGSVTAEVTQASIDDKTGLPVTLGNGTVGVAGIGVAAGVTVDGDRVSVDVAGLVSFSLSIPLLDVLPCVGGASLVPGALELTCSFTSLPPVLQGAVFGL